MNKKTKFSAVSAIAAAVLLIGLMIMLPFLPANMDAENGFAAFFILLFSLYGDIAIYASAVSFTIVALVFSIRIMKNQSPDKLISYNKRLLIAACVLLPFLAVGLVGNSGSIYPSNLGPFPLIYTIVAVVAYVACLIAQILSMSALKNNQSAE